MAEDIGGIAEAYRAPLEDDDDGPEVGTGAGAFYVVSPSKLVILYLSTFGAYRIYWFYKHWQCQKYAYRLDVWPIARTIFAVFYVHGLFRSMDLAAHGKGQQTAWNPNSQAWLWIAISIGSNFIGQLSRLGGAAGLMLGAMAPMAMTLINVLPLLQAQKVANQAEGDPEGSRNRNLTALNYLAMLIGVGMLASIVASIIMLRRVLLSSGLDY